MILEWLLSLIKLRTSNRLLVGTYEHLQALTEDYERLVDYVNELSKKVEFQHRFIQAVFNDLEESESVDDSLRETKRT